MASITLKGLPTSLHRALKARAAKNKRSLNQEVIAVLEQETAPSRRVDVEAMIAQAQAFRSSLKIHLTPAQVNAAKRRGRP